MECLLEAVAVISMPCISLMEMNPNRVLVLDTETTGLDSETDELLQIAIVEYDGDGRFNSVRKSLNRLMTKGMVRREGTKTVVMGWRYFLFPECNFLKK